MAAVINLLKDIFTDLKSSRRFQVATVLWIPLFVTAFVLFVRFCIINNLEERFHEWKHTMVPKSSLTYPDALMYFADPAGLNVDPPVCTQPNGPNPSQKVNVQKGPCPFNQTKTCYTFGFSAFTSSGMDLYTYAIQCNLMFNPAVGQNDMIYVHFPGGFATMAGGWHQDPIPIRPNQATAVHLEPEHFFPMHSSPIDMWHARVHYESTVFTFNSNNTFPANIWLRIPYTMINAHWEAIGVDSWVLMALWGGGFFFFYFLHVIAFGIAKLWLPNDSKLLRVPESTEYTPIK
eukprot:TRINITY_DN11028_c0_g1_i1.p1 TRINITY_DN11028_c0_g1~~TRINITY_DN11028_c0_g1_i1.p1  ORF type:complete len:290 (+),score=77.56 TRINITY_DN11028_c0_g1_i1:129-998(+)